jgi:hypothetical protein
MSLDDPLKISYHQFFQVFPQCVGQQMISCQGLGPRDAKVLRGFRQACQGQKFFLNELAFQQKILAKTNGRHPMLYMFGFGVTVRK